MKPVIIRTDIPPRRLPLLADDSTASVDDYAGCGACYAARPDERSVSEYVLLHPRPFTAEVVGLADAADYQRRGIGTTLPARAVPVARNAGFRIVGIGAGDTSTGQTALCERWKFVRCGVGRGCFRKYYPMPVFADGAECRDMVRLRTKLD